MRRVLLALVLLAPALALAQGSFRTTQGDEYVRLPGPDLVLQSAAPVTHRVGAVARAIRGIETVILRQDCTADSSLLGPGGWHWTGGGLLVTFHNTTLAFPWPPAFPVAEACRP